jgi:hypothetical protein
MIIPYQRTALHGRYCRPFAYNDIKALHISKWWSLTNNILIEESWFYTDSSQYVFKKQRRIFSYRFKLCVCVCVWVCLNIKFTKPRKGGGGSSSSINAAAFPEIFRKNWTNYKFNFSQNSLDGSTPAVLNGRGALGEGHITRSVWNDLPVWNTGYKNELNAT